MMKFFDREFPNRWRFEFQEFLKEHGRISNYQLLISDRGVDGFARLTFADSERPIERFYMHRLPKPWGQLGPIGVSKDTRGKGFGRALLDESRFDKPFGIPACGSFPDPEADSVCMSVHLSWNQLIGEGLLAYGFRVEAARLTTNLMNAVIQNLKHNRAFYQRYHAVTGAGLGERNALTGLAPLGLFLQTLGVTILSATRVRLEGKNPFPWQVTITYRGLTIQRGADSTEVTFANGKSVTVTDTKAVIVSL